MNFKFQLISLIIRSLPILNFLVHELELSNGLRSRREIPGYI